MPGESAPWISIRRYCVSSDFTIFRSTSPDESGQRKEKPWISRLVLFLSSSPNRRSFSLLRFSLFVGNYPAIPFDTHKRVSFVTETGIFIAQLPRRGFGFTSILQVLSTVRDQWTTSKYSCIGRLLSYLVHMMLQMTIYCRFPHIEDWRGTYLTTI